MSDPGSPLRVVVVDDQQLVRSGFALMLSVEDDIEVVGEAADGRQAVELVERLRPDVALMDVQMPVLDGIEATREIVARDLAKVIILTTFDRDDYVFDGLQAGASGFLLKNAGPERLVEAVRAVGLGHALLAPEVTRRVIAQMTRPARHPDDALDHAPDRTRVARAFPGGDAREDPPHGSPSPGSGDRQTGVTGESGVGARHTGGSGHERELARLTPREREVLTLLARGLSNAEIARELFLGEATVKTHVSNCLTKLGLRDRVRAVVFAYEAGLILPGE